MARPTNQDLQNQIQRIDEKVDRKHNSMVINTKVLPIACRNCHKLFSKKASKRNTTGLCRYCFSVVTKKGIKKLGGLYNSPEYEVWRQMRYRCSNANASDYCFYGGKGIKVCSRWDDFLKFYEDMGPRPKGYTLDRIDGSRGYSPANCKWATQLQQQSHISSNVYVRIDNKVQHLAAWYRELGIEKNKVLWRRRKGWGLADALGVSNAEMVDNE